MNHNKLWGGLFTKTTAQDMESLNSSINIDKRLYAEDIRGSQAYAHCLQKVDLLTEEELVDIESGLEQVKEEWDSDKFIIDEFDEDIHTANERRLKKLVGEPAMKLHVGRSRNDQISTDMRLWLRKALNELDNKLRSLIVIMVERASREIDILMPGYTHLQRAQTVRWSHWLLSHTWNIKSDVDKIKNLLKTVNVLPLGSGALAGNPLKIDRQELAKLLDFESVSQNSMQAIGDRDFIADFLFWSSLLGIHLSRLAEDLIIFCSKEFGFVILDESYSTGSSLMPQKRNPDSLELIRGIGGSLFGYCCSLMMSLKGLPSSYNKDLQNDKEHMFNAFDKLMRILNVAINTIKTLEVRQDMCSNALTCDMLATDVAYYLVKKRVPFREAHHIAGGVVAAAERKKCSMKDLTLLELQKISPHFEEDFEKLWNFENSVEQYCTEGGTSKCCVEKQIDDLLQWLDKENDKI